jgi:hypothetical protein
VQRRLGVKVSLTTLFAQPVLKGLAEAIEEAARSHLPPIGVSTRDQPLPLSFAQQRLWFLAQLEGVSETYHVRVGLHLSGALDRAALQRALDRVVERHEALRTRF